MLKIERRVTTNATGNYEMYEERGSGSNSLEELGCPPELCALSMANLRGNKEEIEAAHKLVVIAVEQRNAE